MIPIPKITPQIQKVPFSCNLYDSYIEKAMGIITKSQNDRMTESRVQVIDFTIIAKCQDFGSIFCRKKSKNELFCVFVCFGVGSALL